ncbi:hypothetical protein EVAR_84622_1 [Eumeta japonica]|uniref:Uncharacterized protein n=1 Tax=Eumeta variegata TaxID=151549 RepID=A0A4C1UZ27_EUMVA|nr:hypothetical protein EVAR_84622_1 [Eumeta japonica]
MIAVSEKTVLAAKNLNLVNAYEEIQHIMQAESASKRPKIGLRELLIHHGNASTPVVLKTRHILHSPPIALLVYPPTSATV